MDYHGSLLALMSWKYSWAPEISWGSAVGCLHVSVYATGKYAGKRQQLFLLLMLFALSWGVLIPYYVVEPAWKPDELLPTISSFLLYLFGHQLRREAGAREFSLDGWDHTAIWLFLFLFIPGFFKVTIGHLLPWLNPTVFGHACSVVVALCAFVALFRGIAEWDGVHARAAHAHGTWAVWFALAVMVVYFLGELSFTLLMDWDLISGSRAIPEFNRMPDALAITFGVLKVLLTLLIIPIVGRHTEAGRGSAWRALCAIPRIH